MSPAIVALVLLAAVMHAAWNALVKAGRDRLVAQAAIIGTGMVLGAIAAPFVVAPAPASLPFLALSVLIHSGYFLCLLRAYHYGDLSHVYPIARGSAPLLVAALSAAFAHEVPGPGELFGLMLVSLGIGSLAFAGRGAWGTDPRALLFALGTGLFIAAYTLCDGLGVRSSGSALGYIVWLNVFDGLPLCLFAVVRRRGLLGPALRNQWRSGVGGGVLATLAYGIAIWALGVAPMAQVSALRETSVVIAALIGTTLLGEPFARSRVGCAAVVAAGVVALRLFS